MHIKVITGILNSIVSFNKLSYGANVYLLFATEYRIFVFLGKKMEEKVKMKKLLLRSVGF